MGHGVPSCAQISREGCFVHRLQDRGDRASRVVLSGQFVSSVSTICSPRLTPPHCSLTTNIVYMPETIAERPSALRERAYIEGGPVAAPTLDPGGWKLLPRVKAAGTLAPNAIVTAQLSIANPVRTLFITPLTNVQCVFGISCHSHWVHRFRYSSSSLMTGQHTLIPTRSMFVSSAPSRLVVSPVACTSLTLRALRSGQHQAALLAG